MRLSVGGRTGPQVEQALQDSHSSGTEILEEAILHGVVDIRGVSSGSIVLQLRPVTDQAVQTLLNVRENNRLVEMIVGMLKKVNIASMMDGTEPLEIKVQVYKANPGKLTLNCLDKYTIFFFKYEITKSKLCFFVNFSGCNFKGGRCRTDQKAIKSPQECTGL